MAYIKNLTERVLYEHWDRVLPVPIERVVGRHGILLKSGELSADRVGVHGRQADGKEFFLIDSKVPQVVRRFALAHMLAHQYLGGGGEEVLSNFSTRASLVEQPANDMAGRLLVPDIALRYLVFKRGLNDINQIAETLKASPVLAAMRIRQSL